ncbi:MAG: hypothetical protein OXG59_05290 [Gammaproteobacteria bacterium]|nr:hypothetical protein [Gammaproteobacteria bacterium]MCY3940775.1 hypothetical protein [Gammaproteobacteria bacterium]MCY3989310.1 hypothetical protein [Gammaproteobacteria bacterium]
MKEKAANELKECAGMATLARDYFWCLRWSAQSAERELQAVVDSIESLQRFEDIDVLNRRHYLHKHIRKCISEVLETVDFISPAAEPVRKSMSDLQKKIEDALRQVETEDGEAPTMGAQLKRAGAYGGSE